MYVLITTLFIAASLGVLLLAQKAKDPVGIVHMLFFVVFMNILHLAGLLGSNDYRYDIIYYLAAHVVVFSYLFFFTLGMLWLRNMGLAPSRDCMFQTAVHTNDSWLIAAFAGWLVVKVYLVLRYGVSAFSLFSHLAGKDMVLHFYAWWETPLEYYTRDFAVGACGVYVIKAVLQTIYWRAHWVVTVAFCLFLAVYVGTHSSIVGPRRFMLVLVLLGLTTVAWRDKKSIAKFVISKWRPALVTTIILCCMVSYYQIIRNNFFQPDIANKLSSGDLMTFVQGVARSMIPVPESERIAAPAKYFREGPLSIVYEVIQKRGDGINGTEGEITINAFLNSIPRILVGGKKKDINPDEIMYARMGVVQLLNGIDPLAPDVATSLLAILVADFGVVGVVLAPIIMLFSLTSFVVLLQMRLLNFTLIKLFIFSAILNVAASVEGSLTIILTSFRDLLILIIVMSPILIVKNSYPNGTFRNICLFP